MSLKLSKLLLLRQFLLSYSVPVAPSDSMICLRSFHFHQVFFLFCNILKLRFSSTAFLVPFIHYLSEVNLSCHDTCLLGKYLTAGDGVLILEQDGCYDLRLSIQRSQECRESGVPFLHPEVLRLVFGKISKTLLLLLWRLYTKRVFGVRC